jgi:hypothetical protein
MNVPADLKALGLPPLEQIGFIYRDLAAAVRLYEPLFGPFSYMDGSTKDALYRGTPADVGMQIAFGKSGEIEIELIQPTSGASPHTEFIGQGREGMHHVRFKADDCDAWVRKLAPLGYESIWYKHWPDLQCKVAYLERKGDPLIIEMFERPW